MGNDTEGHDVTFCQHPNGERGIKKKIDHRKGKERNAGGKKRIAGGNERKGLQKKMKGKGRMGN